MIGIYRARRGQNLVLSPRNNSRVLGFYGSRFLGRNRVRVRVCPRRARYMEGRLKHLNWDELVTDVLHVDVLPLPGTAQEVLVLDVDEVLRLDSAAAATVKPFFPPPAIGRRLNHAELDIGDETPLSILGQGALGLRHGAFHIPRSCDPGSARPGTRFHQSNPAQHS